MISISRWSAVLASRNDFTSPFLSLSPGIVKKPPRTSFILLNNFVKPLHLGLLHAHFTLFLAVSGNTNDPDGDETDGDVENGSDVAMVDVEDTKIW